MRINAHETLTSGLRADIEQLARYNFSSVDAELANTLHMCMTLLKIGKKNFSDRIWLECIQSVGISSYRQINRFLEACLTGRQKADLHVAEKLSLEQKLEELKRFATPSRMEIYKQQAQSPMGSFAFAS